MTEYRVIEDSPKDSWDSFLQKHSVGNFEQCFEYGEISRKAFPKTNVVRLACTRGNEVAGVLQGTYSKYFGFGMTLGVMRAPFVNFEDEDAVNIVKSLLESLEDYAKRNRIIEVRVFVPEAWGFHNVFQSLGYTVTEQLNEYIVDLEKGVDELWKGVSHNKRKNIKKAMSQGVEVFESRKREDLLTFYSMLRAAEERGGFTSYPLSWFEAALELYNPDLLRVFLASWNGKAVSGVFTVAHGRTVFALAAGSFSEGWKVRPNDIMHWKVMEWACQKGYSRYQMGLVSEPPPSEGSKAWGIWRWKREWGGSLNKLQVYHKYFKPRYKLILKAKKIVEKFAAR
ncbi:MAG: peptidoglycan bridge formation glycyltransferase FemA/FemB family protein [Candidatus Bathyarchaeia archaeon]